MAVTPLFLTDIEELKTELRLSKVSATNDVDVQAIIQQSIEDTVTTFMRRLGIARVVQLQAITPPVGNPTTNDEFLYVLARLTEIKLNRANLYRTLPTIFRDSDGSARKEWQNDALTRETDEEKRSAELARIEEECEQNMQLLALEEEIGSESSIQAIALEPDPAPPRPGESAFPGNLITGFD